MNVLIPSPPQQPPLSNRNAYTTWPGGVDPTVPLYNTDNQKFGGARRRQAKRATRRKGRSPSRKSRRATRKSSHATRKSRRATRHRGGARMPPPMAPPAVRMPLIAPTVRMPLIAPTVRMPPPMAPAVRMPLPMAPAVRMPLPMAPAVRMPLPMPLRGGYSRRHRGGYATCSPIDTLGSRASIPMSASVCPEGYFQDKGLIA